MRCVLLCVCCVLCSMGVLCCVCERRNEIFFFVVFGQSSYQLKMKKIKYKIKYIIKYKNKTFYSNQSFVCLSVCVVCLFVWFFIYLYIIIKNNSLTQCFPSYRRVSNVCNGWQGRSVADQRIFYCMLPETFSDSVLWKETIPTPRKSR